VTLAVVVAGGLAEAAAWGLVAARRVSVWRSLALVLAAAGVAALATGDVALTPRVAWPLAAAAGTLAGVGLFAATRVFVAVVVRVWPGFAKQVRAIYGQRAGLSLRATLAAALVVAVGEELFWRGLVQGRGGAGHGRTAGAGVAWLGYVAANLPSASLPIVAGAVVGGVAWGALAWWTGGVLACACCHVAWTELMIAFPPRAAGGEGTGDAGAGR
jgi:membrane protease YdiL (CAAX protease family)